MKTFLRTQQRAMFLAVQLLSVAAFAAIGISATAQTSPSVVTDQLDYPPGSTAFISGSGFQAGEAVTLRVIHVGDSLDNATSTAHAPWTVAADSLGNFSSSWLVPSDQDELGATLLLTADGQSSGLHAEEVFTDGINKDPVSATVW